MTAALPDRQGRAERARELYESGLSLRQVGAAMGVAHTTVRFLLAAGEVVPQPRPAAQRRQAAVVSRAAPHPLDVPPERAAIAYTPERGWHMVQAPPRWFLDLLIEVD